MEDILKRIKVLEEQVETLRQERVMWLAGSAEDRSSDSGRKRKGAKSAANADKKRCKVQESRGSNKDLTTSPSPPPLFNDVEVSDDCKDSKKHFKISKARASKYLASAKSLPISPPPLSVRVSRAALTQSFGMPGMGLLWMSKDRLHQFLIPTYGVNPEMPRTPGAPGLLLSCRKEMCKHGMWTLFVQANEGKKVRWNYAGEYSCKRVGELTADEFTNQDFKVKNNWGEKVAKHKKYLVYWELRARMTLRKRFGREPTVEETEQEAKAILKASYKSTLTSADVIEAFQCGEEHIDVVRIECVSYSHESARTFTMAQKNFDTGAKLTNSKSKSKGATAIQTCGQSLQDSSSEDSPDVTLEDSDDDAAPEPSVSQANHQAAVQHPVRSQRTRLKTYKARQLEELGSD